MSYFGYTLGRTGHTVGPVVHDGGYVRNGRITSNAVGVDMKKLCRESYADGYYAGRRDEHRAGADGPSQGTVRRLFRRMAHHLAHLNVIPGRVASRPIERSPQVSAD